MEERKCMLCFESINDPICIYCYINHVRTWLKDKEVAVLIRNYLLKKIKDKLVVESINDVRCILCNKENVSICYYCTSSSIIRIMNEMNFIEDWVDDFSSSFNYNSYEYDLQIAKNKGHYNQLPKNEFIRR